MPNKKPLYLLLLFAVCRAISFFWAGLHNVQIYGGLLNSPAYIAKIPGKRLKILHCIWNARFARRIISFLVRTPLRKNILKLVHLDFPLPKHQGCIIVTCHTPWKRLLTQWCLEEKFVLLISGRKWNDRRRIIHRQAAGLTELRDLVKHLKLGGRVIVSADVFNNLNNCPVQFLGNRCNASLFAERLAFLSNVPILTIIPNLSNARIEITAGPRFSPGGLNSKPNIITAEIISFFDKEIQNNPAIFSSYVN